MLMMLMFDAGAVPAHEHISDPSVPISQCTRFKFFLFPVQSCRRRNASSSGFYYKPAMAWLGQHRATTTQGDIQRNEAVMWRKSMESYEAKKHGLAWLNRGDHGAWESNLPH